MGSHTVIPTGNVGVSRNVAVSLAIQTGIVLAAVGLDAMGFSEAAVVILFVFGVLLTAVFTTSAAYCLAAAGLSIFCFNYFLVEPRFSLRIKGADVPGTIAVMFVVALFASYIVTQLRASLEKAGEAALVAQNEQLRSNLLRSVSHDLRTPLTSISGNADMLLEDTGGLSAKERRRLIQDIYDDATWLTGVVENLLAITRIEDGKVALKLEAELLDDVAEEALRHVNRDARAHSLEFRPCAELLLVHVDAAVMVQVVVNLVNNAIVHTEAGSHIRVATERRGAQAALVVSDDGAGVRDKERVFEPFFTADTPVADGRRGIGLGLPVCRSLVEAHGGTLLLDDAVPHGAVFTVLLPVEEVDSHA